MKNFEMRTDKGKETDIDFRQSHSKIILTTFLSLALLCSCTQSTSPPSPPAGPDTTSHEFTWHIDTLGDGNSSTLYDVTIINDMTVLAVGSLFLLDPLGQIDPASYSLAIYSNNEWTLRRLYYGGNNLISSIRGIYAFSPNDVWLAAGSVFYWDGVSSQAQLSFSRLSLQDPNATVEKIWGKSNSELYGVGNFGTIVYFNGTMWTKLESRTSVDFQDAWGVYEPANDSSTILFPSSYVFQEAEDKIYQIIGNNVVDTIQWGTGRRVSSVWFDSPDQLFASGGGVFVRHGEEPWKEVTELPLIYTRRVRGTAPNDVMVVGDFGFCAHFNGSTWKYYTGNEVPSFSGSWLSVAMTKNLVVAVGLVGDRAVVLRGVR